MTWCLLYERTMNCKSRFRVFQNFAMIKVYVASKNRIQLIQTLGNENHKIRS